MVYNSMVTVTILLFASLAEALGRRQFAFPLHEGDTVADISQRLIAQYPALARFAPTLLYALNEEYVKAGAHVTDGSTLALIPPVSGGC